ncbi:MAG: hypothetical protein RL556_570 [Actinomycetota bacterium]
MSQWIDAAELNAPQLALEAKLIKVGTRANLFTYLKEVWQRRAFAFTFASFQIQAATARSTLGLAWVVVVPALQILIYGLIFGFVLGSNKPDNYLPYLFIGVAFFQLLSNAITDGSTAITGNQALVNSLDFPRGLLPLAVVISNLIESLPVMILTLIGVAFLGQSVTASWLLLIPVLLLMVVFGAGLTLFSARLAVFLPDFKYLLPFISRVLFYVSGIFWSITKLTGSNHLLQLVLWNNPFHLYINLARSLTISGYETHPTDWLIASVWSVATFFAGMIFFWLAEEKYGRNV